MASVDILQQKGKQLIILCPSTERLTLGIGSDSEPVEFPNVIAYRRTVSTATTRLLPDPTAEEQNARRLAYRDALLALGLSAAPVIGKPLTRTMLDAMDPMDVASDTSVLTGDAVYELSSTECFSVVWPCCVDGLNPNRSILQLRDDLSKIWTSAITNSLKISVRAFRDYGVVLIAPDNYGVGEVEVMIDTLLTDMQFKEIVVHSDSTAACFGQGVSGGCIVHVEDASLRVSCIEDGVMVSGSAVVLPFGGSHVSNALHWMLQESLPSEFKPSKRLCDRRQCAKICAEACFLPREGSDSALEDQISARHPLKLAFRSDAGQSDVVEMEIGAAACLAPMGLFHPQLLVPHSHCSSLRLKSDSESYYSQILADLDTTKQPNSGPSVSCLPLPLDRAVVLSISSAENVDHRRRLYTGILLVGPCSQLKGLSDMLERCVLSALPSDEVIDTVAVLEPKWSSQHIIWKGGLILGLLSDNWIRREEWVNGANAEKPNKFGKREITRSKVHWMFKTEIGLM